MDNLITKVSANETYNLMPTVRRTQLASPPMRVFSHQRLGQIPQLVKHAPQLMEAISLVARVLPFKVNDYVIKHLIDWHDVPNDPIFRLTFPRPRCSTPRISSGSPIACAAVLASRRWTLWCNACATA